MAGNKKMPPIIRRLIDDITFIAIGIAHLIMGKYYDESIPPLAMAFFMFSLFWLILGIACLQHTISELEKEAEAQKKKGKR